MWEIPWWVALIIASAAGSLGFFLGAVLATAAEAERELEEELEERYEIDMKRGRKQADLLFGYDVGRGQRLDTRWTNRASAKRARVIPRSHMAKTFFYERPPMWEA
jgi:hypothetical protein